MNRPASSRRGDHGTRRRLWALLLSLVLWGTGFAATSGTRPPGQPLPPPPRPTVETGLPFIRTFNPKEYGAGSQNWAIVLDPRGVVYVGNNEGVLEFDGVRWRLIRVGNLTGVRSLAIDPSGRVFVGAVGELGYLEPDASGQMRYVSLLDRIPKEERGLFAEVWKTFATKDGIVFASFSRIFRVGPRVQVWKPRASFHLAFQVGERLFVREAGQGLLELSGEEWRLVPGGERFAEEKIYTMLPGEGRDTVLIGSRTQGLFLLEEASLRPFPTQVDADLKRNLLFTAARLEDGNLAFGTLSAGLYILDAQGRLRSHLSQSDGLLAPGVQSLAQDRQGGLWMGLSKGIARAEINFPLTSFRGQNGLDVSVLSVHRHAGTLFAGTDIGLSRLSANPSGVSRFLPFPEIKGQTRAFLDAGSALLAANASGVYELRGGTARLVRPSAGPSTALGRSRVDPFRVFVGLIDGMASMRWARDRWVDEGKIPGITETISAISETAEGRLWAGTLTQGVLRLTFPAGWKGGPSGPAPAIERFTTAQGLPSMNDNYVHSLDGAPRFATHQGVFHFDEASRTFTPDPRFARLFPEGPRLVYDLVKDPRGWIWMDSKDEARAYQESGAAVRGPDAVYRWEPKPLRALAGAELNSIYGDADGVMWFGTTDGLFRYDPRIPRAYDQPFQALLRKVTTRGGKAIFGGAGRVPDPSLKYADNALRFEFAAPSFEGLEGNRFQVLLEGVDRNWTPWSAEAYRDYTNIREGRYRFRVRARNLHGTLSQEGSYDFSILPPWYRHPMAYLLWGLMLAGSILGGFRWRLSALKRHNRELSLAVDQATEGLQARERELEFLNQRLYELNDAKNRIIGLAAHDLRNPLSGILLYCERLQEETLAPELAELVVKIRGLGSVMKALIQRLLDVHAIEAGQAESPKLESMDLGASLATARDQALVAAQHKGIQLVLEAEGPAQVLGDPGQVEQMLANFISNAIKFSPRGTTITLGLTGGSGRWRSSVRDQGPGLTPDDLRRVFGEYARLSARPTAGEASVGLGLSLVKRMAEAMGGAVGVDSVHGQGATFWLELPGG